MVVMSDRVCYGVILDGSMDRFGSCTASPLRIFVSFQVQVLKRENEPAWPSL
jgi:hypothetical protein